MLGVCRLPNRTQGTEHLTNAELPVTEMSARSLLQHALDDLISGARLRQLWLHLAFHDIRQRFRRSVIGPLWLTLSMGIMVGALGLVFSTLFQQDVSKTLPFIATGLIFWGLLVSCVGEGTTVFIGAESYIRNVPMPISVHFYRMIARNTMIWLFNMVIYLVVVVWFKVIPNYNTVYVIPGFVVFLANMSWMSMMAAILSTRYRDIPQVIMNAIQVVFFVTPVFWSAETLPKRPAFVLFNPFYHLLELVRAPLLGNEVPAISWTACICMALIGFAVTGWLYGRTHSRIAYWV